MGSGLSISHSHPQLSKIGLKPKGETDFLQTVAVRLTGRFGGLIELRPKGEVDRG